MAEKRVCLCYRQQDVPFAAGRIADCLKGRLGSESVFQYIDNVGVQFDEIVESLFLSDVVVVVIGKRWQDSLLAGGRRCLEDPNGSLANSSQSKSGKCVDLVPIYSLGNGVNSITCYLECDI
jgi:hypothetical protein